MFDYSDIRGGRFRARTVSGVRSMNDGEHYTVNADGRIDKYSYKTGALVATIFDIKDHPAIGGRMAGYEFSADESKMLITTSPQAIYRHSFTADHWIYDVKARTVRRLTEEGREQVAAFSPDGRKVGFVRGNKTSNPPPSGLAHSDANGEESTPNMFCRNQAKSTDKHSKNHAITHHPPRPKTPIGTTPK